MGPQPKAGAASHPQPEAGTTAAAAAAAETPQEVPAPLPEPGPLEQARTESQRLLRRYRRQLAPLAALAATAAAGAAVAAATGPGVLAVVAAAGGASYGLWRYAKARAGRWARAYAAIGGTGATAWTALAALVGPGGVMQTVLWLGGSVLALPWWIRHSEATPDVTAERARAPEPAPTAPEEAAPDWREIRWDKHIKDSRLTGIEDISFGWRSIVVQSRGDHWRSVAGQLPTIGSIYDLPDGRTFLEPIEGEPVYKSLLTVLTSNPLETVHQWEHPGLDVRTGTFPLAFTGDGEMLHWRLWQPGAGGSHGLVAGTTGSGKSSALDLLLAEAANSDRIVPVIIDGSGGMSLPDWLDHVAYKATNVAETVALLDQLEAAMNYRFEKMARIAWTDSGGRARTGRKSIDPTPEMPGVLIVMDEAHVLLMDAEWGRYIRRRMEILTQMGRKVAFSAVLATQQPSVTQLGGSSVLRDMTKSGTVLALRTAEKVSGGFVGSAHLPEPLHMLPSHWAGGEPTHGLGYVTTARPIRCRTLWPADPYAEAAGLTTQLDAGTAAALQAAPTRTAGTPAPAAPSSGGGVRVVTDDDAIASVREAIEAGTPANPFALVSATGLAYRKAKDALQALRGNGEA